MSWASVLHPCLLCKATKTDWGRLGLFSTVDEPFEAITAAEYEHACSHSETNFRAADRIARVRIQGTLSDDHEIGGRVLRTDSKETLKKGDRLEPGDDLWFLSEFDTKPLPFTVCFWRPVRETIVRHRCPLMSASLGISLHTFALDVSHTLYLIGCMRSLLVMSFGRCCTLTLGLLAICPRRREMY